MITVGLDGSTEGRAAAEWAAREGKLPGLPAKILHVWEPVPEPMAQAPLLGTETQQHWSEKIPRDSAEGLRLRHPGVEVTAEHLAGRPISGTTGGIRRSPFRPHAVSWPVSCGSTSTTPSTARTRRTAIGTSEVSRTTPWRVTTPSGTVTSMEWPAVGYR